MKNRKLIALLTVTLLLQSIPMYPMNVWASTGKANEQEYDEDAIYLSTAEELTALASVSTGEDATVDKVYILKNDIDLTGVEYMPIPVFAGTLDGDGHKIKGLSITEEGTDIGLIRFVGTKGVIKNLVVEAQVHPGGNKSTVGGITGTNKGTIIDCTFAGDMIGKKEIGGIAGVNEETGVIASCKNMATIRGTKRVGGIVGNNEGIVRECSNLGEINHTSETVPKDDENGDSQASFAGLMEDEDKIESIGGIAGISTGTVSACDNKATISYKHMGYQVGGIVGYQNGCVEKSVNNGMVYGRKDVGGIVGLFEPYIEIDYDQDTFSSLQDEMDSLSDMLDSLSDTTRNAGDLLQEDADRISDTTDELHNKLKYYKDYYKDNNKDFDSEVSHQMDDIKDQINDLDFSVNLSTVKKNYQKLQDEIDTLTRLLESYLKAGGSNADKYDKVLEDAKDTADKIKDYINSAGKIDQNDAKDDAEEDQDDTAEDSSDDIEESDADKNEKDDSDNKDSSKEEDKDSEKDSEDKEQDSKNDEKVENKKEESKKESNDDKKEDAKDESGDDEQSKADFGKLFQRKNGSSLQDFTLIPTVDNSQYDVIMIDTDGNGSGNDESDDSDTTDIPSIPTTDIVEQLEKALKNMHEISDDVSHSVSNKVKKAQDLQDDLDDLGDSVDDLYDYVSNQKNKLRDDVGSTSDDLSESGDALTDDFDSMKTDFKSSKNQVREEMDQVKDQMDSIRGTVKDGVERVRNRLESGEFYYDISEKAKPETGNGRMLACLNQAEVNSDINGGGVIGRISIELGNTIDNTFNGKLQFTESGERSLHFDRNVCAAVFACQNDSDIFVKNDYAGGIVGRADYGAVMGCQNYGNIEVEDGDYAGGIAGRSDNLVKRSYSLCDVKAEEYVGGVVGYGTDVIGNTAMATATSSIGSNAGTIAGGVDTDGEVNSNLFVDEGQGAVNGVTYIEEATAVKYERLIRDEDTPDGFKVFQVRYVADNEPLKKLKLSYGGAVKQSDIPEIPEKDGYYAYWEDKNTDFVSRNITVHAKYEAWQNSVGSISTGQDKATMLAQADFYPGTELLCTPIEVPDTEIPAGYQIKAAYHYQLMMQKDKDIEQIIYRVSAENLPEHTVIAVRSDKGFVLVDTKKVDSYLQFVSGEKENDILLLQKNDVSAYICVVLFVLLAVAAGVAITLKSKKKR